jgi:transcription elongation factor Elf1
MATPTTCPRCSAPRLTVIYYGADGAPIGGHTECTACGPRYAVELERTGVQPPDVQEGLLERKAS